MSTLPTKSNQQALKVQEKTESFLTSVSNTFQGIFKGLSDLITGDGHKKTKVLRVEQLVHAESIKKIAIELNDINNELNNIKEFNYNSQKLFEQTTKFMQNTAEELVEIDSAIEKFEGFLGLKLNDLEYLKQINEIKELLITNKKDQSIIVSKQDEIQRRIDDLFPIIDILEEEIEILKAGSKSLELSINENKERSNEISIETTKNFKKHEKELRTINADLVKTERNIDILYEEMKEKINFLESKNKEFKTWLIVLSVALALFLIEYVLLNFLL